MLDHCLQNEFDQNDYQFFWTIFILVLGIRQALAKVFKCVTGKLFQGLTSFRTQNGAEFQAEKDRVFNFSE